MSKITAAIRNFVREEEGASAVEYALLVALIGIAFIAGAKMLGANIDTQLKSVAGTVANPQP